MIIFGLGARWAKWVVLNHFVNFLVLFRTAQAFYLRLPTSNWQQSSSSSKLYDFFRLVGRSLPFIMKRLARTSNGLQYPLIYSTWRTSGSYAFKRFQNASGNFAITWHLGLRLLSYRTGKTGFHKLHVDVLGKSLVVLGAEIYSDFVIMQLTWKTLQLINQYKNSTERDFHPRLKHCL